MKTRYGTYGEDWWIEDDDKNYCGSGKGVLSFSLSETDAEVGEKVFRVKTRRDGEICSFKILFPKKLMYRQNAPYFLDKVL